MSLFYFEEIFCVTSQNMKRAIPLPSSESAPEVCRSKIAQYWWEVGI